MLINLNSANEEAIGKEVMDAYTVLWILLAISVPVPSQYHIPSSKFVYSRKKFHPAPLNFHVTALKNKYWFGPTWKSNEGSKNKKIKHNSAGDLPALLIASSCRSSIGISLSTSLNENNWIGQPSSYVDGWPKFSNYHLHLGVLLWTSPFIQHKTKPE